jgi:hypothetical protein
MTRRSTSLPVVSVPRAIEPKTNATIEQAGLVQTRQLFAQRPGHGAGQPRDLAQVQASFGV